MFRKKPLGKVEVIGVTQVRSGKTKVSYFGHGYEDDRYPSIDLGLHTIVLLTVDGVMKTQILNGRWTLTQVRNWKGSNYANNAINN